MTFPATPNIAIIGLGYVGLPLAVEFGKKYPVTGFDIKQGRIDELKAGRDSTPKLLYVDAAATQFSFTARGGVSAKYGETDSRRCRSKYKRCKVPPRLI